MSGRLSIVAVLSVLASAASSDPVRPHEPRGVGYRIEEIAPHTPAADAGLRPGDRIMAIDGRPVTGAVDIDRAVARSGRSLVVSVERGGRVRRLRIVPRALAAAQAADYEAAPPRVLGIVRTEQRFVLRAGTGANDAYVPPPIPPDPPPPPPMIAN
ncbi:MAG TPA: PDZ domain-containing protein [Xanthobacteraceae bacterium]|nr:PDZ domain-containing protein [Xanthobacteraceae bacterium]